jgi:uncharacterized protein YidB (DUF937 family)
MSLLDIFTGGQSSSGRVPPIAKALAGLLSYSQLNKPGGPTGARATDPDYGQQLEDFFKPAPGGGPTAKGVIGALLTGGMMDLVQQFRGAGKTDAVDSWIAPGSNETVSSDQIAEVLTEDQIAFLMQRTGLSRQELLAGLSERLPEVVDQLTPEGRMPTAEEMQRRF